MRRRTPAARSESDAPNAQTAAIRHFTGDTGAQAALASIGQQAEVDAANFNGVIQPGGHGPLWALAR